MSTYTVELGKILETEIELFDFEYPIFDESYRPVLEDKIKNHFYFREIGFETFGRFKFYLKKELQLIMPHYNKMYKATNLEQRILDNYEVVESYDRTTANNSNNTTATDSDNTRKFSDTPQGATNLSTNYLTDLTETTDTANTVFNGTDSQTENWVRKMSGNIGVQTDSEAVRVYIENILNIDELILNRLDTLFMQVY